MRRRLAAIALPVLTAGFLIASAPNFAASTRKPAPAAELREKQSDLGELRQRIGQLQKDMAAAESARSEATDELRDQERAISELQREIHLLGQQRDALRRRLADLGQETRQAESRLSTHQTQLERVLARHYMTGAPGPLGALFSGAGPNQIARDLTYLTHIGRARQDVARQTAGLIEEKREIGTRMQQEAAELASVEARQKAQQEAMLAQREARKSTLRRLADRLDTQRREIETLRRNEQRLARLVDRLDKLIAARAKAARQAKSARDAKDKGPAKKLIAGKAATTARQDDEPAGALADLAKLKGRLPPPSPGPITQRFGASLEGGIRSKGIFVRAASGSPVQAVGAGQVVFADWMRGFGNLLVVDHGNGFMSIYGNTDAILKQVGDDVRAAETIAAAGNSGGRAETGLYFELRRRGEPLDPGQWIRR